MKDAIQIQPSRVSMELLEAKRPDLFLHGRNYAIECLIAESLNQPKPPTPREAMGATAAKRRPSRKKPSTRKS
jgi:hypothetical protein